MNDQLHNLSAEQKNKVQREMIQFEFPKVFTVSLGEWQCNINCRMCPMYNQPPQFKRVMSREVFEKACDAVGDRKVSFEISAWGETFQHPESFEFLKICREKCPNAVISVNTNGVLLNEENCKKVVDSNIDQVIFSVDAGSKETYEWLTGSTQYERVCQNLETLVRVRNAKSGSRLKISAHIIGLKELAHEFQPFIKRWQDVVDQAYVRPYSNWGGLVDTNGCTPSDVQEVPEQRYPCMWLYYATKIEPNGDVSKCFVNITGDKHPVGNIMEDDFVSIWQGYHINRLRQLHEQQNLGKTDHCHSCIVWSLFPNVWHNQNSSTSCAKPTWGLSEPQKAFDVA